MRITNKLLQDLGACSDQVRLFKTNFGDEAELNSENIEKALRIGLDVRWLFLTARLTGSYSDDRATYWYCDGKLHRKDGPAIEYSNGDKKWYTEGKLHRVDGPAVEYINGSKFWFFDDELHREDGPAAVYEKGSKFWYIKGKLHRDDGPAVEHANRDKREVNT